MSLRKASVVLAFLTGSLLSLSGCIGGSTDGGKEGDENFQGTTFVPNEDNSGSVKLTVTETELPVSQITGFSFAVKDANHQPVSEILASCDSEAGVAIIEPTTGTEITDSLGQISGKIGCAAPGSFQFGCRLPVGGNLREFVRIKCTGGIPQGFDGFPGAAGGGLGTGGVHIPGVSTDNVNITGISVLDNPGDSSTEGDQVDIIQDICVADDPTTTTSELVVEAFSDTRIKIKVRNETNSAIQFTKFNYTVPNFDGTGRTFQSSDIRFIGEATVDAGGADIDLSALVFSVTGTGGDKFFVNSSTGNKAITGLGFRNVTFELTGVTNLDQEVIVSGTTVLSFQDYNRCG